MTQRNQALATNAVFISRINIMDLLSIYNIDLHVLSYLNNIHLFPGVAPDFKLLVVSLCVLSNADSTHL